jgi:hypothetical protein
MANEFPCVAIAQANDGGLPAEPLAPLRFDYASLDAETRNRVEAEVAAIASRICGDAGQRIEIGERLIALRDLVGRFAFQPIVLAEYGWCKGTTTNYMNVARVFPGLDPQCRLKMSWYALVVLARENVDPAIRNCALEWARAGRFINKRLAECLVANARDGAVDGHGPLLDKLHGTSQRFIELLEYVGAVRPEFTPDEDAELDELLADVQQALVAMPAGMAARPTGVAPELAVPPVAEVARLHAVDNCGAGVPPAVITPTEFAIAPVAELARVQTSASEPPIPPAGETPAPQIQPTSTPLPADRPSSLAVQPVARPSPSRRSCFAAVGSALGAIFLGSAAARARTGSKVTTAAAPIPGAKPSPEPSVPPSRVPSSRVTVYQYDANGQLLSITDSPYTSHESTSG